MKKCIILANGRAPKKSVLNYFIKKGYDFIAADGGANSAFKFKLIPGFIIGDFDSILPDIYNYYSGKSKIIKIKRQNDTDIEKCLKFAYKNKYSEVILTGVTGDRLDHTFCNLGIMIKFFNFFNLKLIAENSILIAYKNKAELETEPGETISLYGFDSKTLLTSKGLQYKLNKTALPFGQRESTSNVATKNRVEIDIKGGLIFIIRDFELMRKNEFI